jgi:hypothetical protein
MRMKMPRMRRLKKMTISDVAGCPLLYYMMSSCHLHSSHVNLDL